MEQDKFTDNSNSIYGEPYTPPAQADNSYRQPMTVNTNPIILNTQAAAPAPAPQPASPNMQTQTETHGSQEEAHPAKRIVGVIFSIIEVILSLRIVFKLLGANADSGFVQVIYNITNFFVNIFGGIFEKVTINADSNAVFEPAALIAIVVVGLIALGILKLMTPHTGSRVVRSEYSGPTDQSGRQK